MNCLLMSFWAGILLPEGASFFAKAQNAKINSLLKNQIVCLYYGIYKMSLTQYTQVKIIVWNEIKSCTIFHHQLSTEEVPKIVVYLYIDQLLSLLNYWLFFSRLISWWLHTSKSLSTEELKIYHMPLIIIIKWEGPHWKQFQNWCGYPA